jgi:hypothetical protein
LSIWFAQVCRISESLGFILGAYTVPPNIPVLYVTDSNNARTLQRNVTNLQLFTHRKIVRKVKQSINASIANHLEYLSAQRGVIGDNSFEHMLLNNEIEKCKVWAEKKNHQDRILELDIGMQNNLSHTDERIQEDDDSTVRSINTLNIEPNERKTDRYRFDDTMYNELQSMILLKVYSHQLNKHWAVECPGKEPSPNWYITSANQYADNAASMARDIIPINDEDFDDLRYPPFSPRWCFTFEGHIINNGAHKLLQSKLDDELFYRLQHRCKQGLFS